MKKQYNKPQLECTEVTVGQFLCNSLGGKEDTGDGGTGGIEGAPARTLYV